MNSTTRSLRLLKIEAVITASVLAMSFMTEFFKSIGMNHMQIGLSQAIFTIVMIILDPALGYIADKLSRKWCNVIGDTIAAIGFIGYAGAQSFAHVVAAEIVLGIGLAFSGGVDVTLIRAYCHKLQRNYNKEWAHVSQFRPLVEAAFVLLGGIVAATVSIRFAILLSAVPFIIAAILSLLIEEGGTQRQSTEKPWKDFVSIIKYSLHGHKQLAWTILTAAVAREITHPTIWLLTALLLSAGLDGWLLGAGWAINSLAVFTGARIAGSHAQKLREWQRFALPAVMSLITLLVLGTWVNILTIALYASLGFTRGWYAAVMSPMIQAHTPDDIQTTVMSVANSTARVLYIPLVWGIGALADISVSTALYGTFLVFAPLVLVSTLKLRQYERM